MTRDAYLEAQGQSADEHDAEIEQRAREAIRSQFVLDKIAVKEELGVSEPELTEHILRRAARAGVSPDVFAQQVVEAGQVPVLMSEVLRGKALALVVEAANVTDESGRTVDLEELREDSPAPATTEETVTVDDAAPVDDDISPDSGQPTGSGRRRRRCRRGADQRRRGGRAAGRSSPRNSAARRANRSVCLARSAVTAAGTSTDSG